MLLLSFETFLYLGSGATIEAKELYATHLTLEEALRHLHAVRVQQNNYQQEMSTLYTKNYKLVSVQEIDDLPADLMSTFGIALLESMES